MQDVEVQEWLRGYLNAFAAAARDRIAGAKLRLEFYGVPLIPSTSAGLQSFTTHEQVVEFVNALVKGLPQEYSHTDLLQSELIRVNDGAVVWRTEFSRRAKDGHEIERSGGTYFIVNGDFGPRICVIGVHS